MERGSKGFLEKLLDHVIWRVIISVLYITGLTLLIPFVFLFVFPQEYDIVSPATSPVLIWSAMFMILVSIFVTVMYKKSLGAAFKSLGRVTFIPGFIGLIFSIFGRDVVLLYLAGTIPAFQKVQSLLTLYVDAAVPRVRYLTLGFFVLGVVLWLMGDKLETDAAISKARYSFTKFGR
jgi:hypothetical protein